MRALLMAAVVLAGAGALAGGSVTLSDGDNLKAAVEDAAQYDEIVLNAGTYPITATVTLDRKMTIRGADGTTPDEVVLEGDETCGLMKITVNGSLLSGVTMKKGKISSNSTTYVYGAAVWVTSVSVVSNCVFTENTLNGKGAVGVVVLDVANSVLTHSRITKNTFARDVQYGGGIGLAVRCSGSPCYVRNTLIADNDQTVTSSQTNGGMIGAVGGSSAWIVNCTIVNNRVQAGPAVFGSYGTGSIRSVNNLIVGNTYRGEPSIGNATWYNSLTDVAVTGTECALTNTAIFADYANADYHLTKNSTSAIDAGTCLVGKTAITVEATDLDGNTRIMGDEVDIGCYEYDPDARSVTFTVTPDGGTEPIALTFTATPNGLGDAPTYYWDFDGDGAAEFVTTEPTFTRTFLRGTYPVTLSASNLTANVGISYSRAEAMEISAGLSLAYPETDWWFEPFTEPLTATLTGDLGDAPRYYWDWTGDGVTDAVTDGPVLNHTFAAGSYPVTVIASNLVAGVGIAASADEPMTVLVRPRVTVTASDPTAGITAADIQTAIDAAERGSIVTIPAGTHDIKGTPIKVVKEIELRGATGRPEDVIIRNSAGHHRLLNVDGGVHCLIHSMTLANGKGGKANESTEFGSGLMIAAESGFETESNETRPGATKGGCVSNVIVRGCSTGGNYGDPCTVYLKGAKAKFTHSVISNNTCECDWAGTMFNSLALFVGAGATAENLLVCDNRCSTSGSYPSRRTVTATVNGAGSVLRFSTVVNNTGGFGGGVNVYNGGRFEYCVIAGNASFNSGDVARRNVWTSYALDENGRIQSDSFDSARETEATRAATESIYSVQITNAVDVADCLNATTVYSTLPNLVMDAAARDYALPRKSPARDVVPRRTPGLPASDRSGYPRPRAGGYDLGSYEVRCYNGALLMVR